MSAEATVELTSTIERLRASKAQHIAEQSALGHPMGREWARDVASYAELELLAFHTELELLAFHTEGDSSEAAISDVLDSDLAAGPAGQFVRLIRPNSENDTYSIAEFWQPWVGEDERTPPSGGFVQGFLRGALEVWAEVEDQL